VDSKSNNHGVFRDTDNSKKLITLAAVGEQKTCHRIVETAQKKTGG
jgi:hypothetical protein